MTHCKRMVLRVSSEFGAIVLAAGQSERFQSNKFLADVSGQPLLQRTLTPFIELKPYIKALCVVTGAYTAELQPLLQELAVKQSHNADYKLGGMSSSIKRGLIGVQEQVISYLGVFIHPGDIPFILRQDLLTMISTQEMNCSKIVIPTFEGRKGHPLLIHSSLIHELSNLKESRQGLRGFLVDHSDEIDFAASSNPGILHDIDYPRDLEGIALI
ncbi:MAG: NTP transferase domain-containing protein [Candidatus Heimdallarchaeota archaeon]